MPDEKAFRDVFIAVKPLHKEQPLCLDDLYSIAFLEWHHNVPASYSFFHTLDAPTISLLSHLWWSWSTKWHSNVWKREFRQGGVFLLQPFPQQTAVRVSYQWLEWAAFLLVILWRENSLHPNSERNQGVPAKESKILPSQYTININQY